MGLSKGSFAKTLLAYPKFITGDTKFAPGTLACHNPDGKGFLACMRPVASTYFTLPLTSFGWAIENDKLIVDWDSSENTTTI